jgi:hypothetical protein
MNKLEIFVESGKKKVFAGALAWPGWCRFGRDEEKAFDAFLAYGERYARVLEGTDFNFQTDYDPSDLVIRERHPGTSTTDFGAPVAVLAYDHEQIDPDEYARVREILSACWWAFDQAVETAQGKELRKGPRGGGRDLEKIITHVFEADRQYLRKLAGKFKPEKGCNPKDELPRIRSAIFQALDVAERGELPAQGPRGGVIWPPRFFIRRVAWHILDHAWEIEDRLVNG